MIYLIVVTNVGLVLANIFLVFVLYKISLLNKADTLDEYVRNTKIQRTTKTVKKEEPLLVEVDLFNS